MWAVLTWCTELKCLAQGHLSRVDVCQRGGFTPSAPGEEWPLWSHLAASLNKECVLFLYTSWKREYKAVCVPQECFPSGHSLPVTSGQFALALPLSISHYSSDHLLSSHTLRICQEAIQMRERARASLLQQPTSLLTAERKRKRVIKGASLEQWFPPRGACSHHPLEV